MSKPPGPETEDLFDLEDEEAEERALAQAEAEMDAGKGVPWGQVRAWLGTWGTPQEPPSMFTETGAGEPFAEVEAKIEAAIEQAERAKSIKRE